MDILGDKVAIVTGARSGIGAETAVVFAARGAKVAITGLQECELIGTAIRCRAVASSDDNILIIAGDLTKQEDIERIVDSTASTFGRIDILVNNAGSLIVGYFEDTSDDDVRQMFNINTLTVFNMTKKTIPWLQMNHGCVVNVSSIAGHRACPSALAYGMSRAAVDQLTKCLALEYASKGVRINAVNPGAIETDIIRDVISIEDTTEAKQRFWEEQGLRYPMQRVGQPSEVAAAILFLASDQSSFITGTLFPVCGGRECCIEGSLVI